MSLESKQTIQCPRCGQENDFTIWHSLNGDLDRKAKKRLLEGKLFDYECKQCGHIENMCYEMLYHDMKNKAMIHLVSESFVEKTKAMIKESKDLMMDNKQMGNKMQGYRNRIVTDANSLREKADIFDNGLDDRVIEILKIAYYSDLMDQNPQTEIRNMYFYVEEDKYLLCFISDDPFSVEIPIDMYEDFAYDLSKELIKLGDDEAVIDRNWAIAFLNTEVTE